jgi:hypothetical protein
LPADYLAADFDRCMKGLTHGFPRGVGCLRVTRCQPACAPSFVMRSVPYTRAGGVSLDALASDRAGAYVGPNSKWLRPDKRQSLLVERHIKSSSQPFVRSGLVEASVSMSD